MVINNRLYIDKHDIESTVGRSNDAQSGIDVLW